MSASEIYDFVSAASPATPDYNYTLTLHAQGTVTEVGSKNQEVHIADDESEEIITICSTSVFRVSWDWRLLTEANAGTIMDLYFDPAKANGIARSFLWSSYDGHTYKVRFDCKMQRTINRMSHGVSQVVLKILGKIS